MVDEPLWGFGARFNRPAVVEGTGWGDTPYYQIAVSGSAGGGGSSGVSSGGGGTTTPDKPPEEEKKEEVKLQEKVEFGETIASPTTGNLMWAGDPHFRYYVSPKGSLIEHFYGGKEGFEGATYKFDPNYWVRVSSGSVGRDEAGKDVYALMPYAPEKEARTFTEMDKVGEVSTSIKPTYNAEAPSFEKVKSKEAFTIPIGVVKTLNMQPEDIQKLMQKVYETGTPYGFTGIGGEEISIVPTETGASLTFTPRKSKTWNLITSTPDKKGIISTWYATDPYTGKETMIGSSTTSGDQYADITPRTTKFFEDVDRMYNQKYYFANIPIVGTLEWGGREIAKGGWKMVGSGFGFLPIVETDIEVLTHVSEYGGQLSKLPIRIKTGDLTTTMASRLASVGKFATEHPFELIGTLGAGWFVSGAVSTALTPKTTESALSDIEWIGEPRLWGAKSYSGMLASVSEGEYVGLENIGEQSDLIKGAVVGKGGGYIDLEQEWLSKQSIWGKIKWVLGKNEPLGGEDIGWAVGYDVKLKGAVVENYMGGSAGGGLATTGAGAYTQRTWLLKFMGDFPEVSEEGYKIVGKQIVSGRTITGAGVVSGLSDISQFEGTAGDFGITIDKGGSAIRNLFPMGKKMEFKTFTYGIPKGLYDWIRSTATTSTRGGAKGISYGSTQVGGGEYAITGEVIGGAKVDLTKTSTLTKTGGVSFGNLGSQLSILATGGAETTTLTQTMGGVVPITMSYTAEKTITTEKPKAKTETKTTIFTSLIREGRGDQIEKQIQKEKEKTDIIPIKVSRTGERQLQKQKSKVDVVPISTPFGGEVELEKEREEVGIVPITTTFTGKKQIPREDYRVPIVPIRVQHDEFDYVKEEPPPPTTGRLDFKGSGFGGDFGKGAGLDIGFKFGKGKKRLEPIADILSKTITEMRTGKPARSPSVGTSLKYWKKSFGMRVPTAEMLKKPKIGRGIFNAMRKKKTKKKR